MPLIRYIYGPDIREHGDQPVVVEDVTAKHLTALRRAVLVDTTELAELPKAKLAEVADQVGAEVSKRDSKGQFVKAIAEATDQ
jgi:hypothetical protein